MQNPIIQTHSIIDTAPGTNQYFHSIHYRSDTDGKKIYIQAAIHADEIPGILTIQFLKKKLDQLFKDNLLTGEIILVPFANPIGLNQFIKGNPVGRFDLDLSGNFNRDFFDLATASINDISQNLTGDLSTNISIIRNIFKKQLKNYQPQLIADDLKKKLLQLSCDADYVFDLHCDTQSILHIYANQTHQQVAATLANYLKSPILLIEDNPGGFAFDEANASPWWRIQNMLSQQGIDKPIDNACFAATIELRGQLDVCPTTNQQDADRLIQFLNHIGAIQEQPIKPQATKLQQSNLQAVDVVQAPHTGMVTFSKKLGDTVKKGEAIATLYQLNNDFKETTLYAKTDGILFTMINHHLVRPGYTVAKIAGTKNLDHQKGKLLAL